MTTDLRTADRAAPAMAPLLLTAQQSAAACGKSVRTWRSWQSLGLIPAPVRVGKAVLWRADELRRWIDAGCPRRAEWEVLHGP